MALVKMAGDRGVNLVETMFYRQAFALPVALVFLMLGPGLPSVRTKRIGAHAVRTGVGLSSMILTFFGVLLLPLAEATTIGFTIPIFATILSIVILGERAGIHRWSAVTLGFCGMLIMVRPGGEHFPLFGAAIALSGAVITALISVLLRQLARTEEPLAIVFWFCVLSLIPLGAGLIFYGQMHDPVTWGLLLLVGTFGGFGQIFLTTSLKWAPVSVVLPMDYSGLIWATLLGWFVWSTWPDWTTWLGAALIVASGLYIVWRESRPGAARKEEPLPVDPI